MNGANKLEILIDRKSCASRMHTTLTERRLIKKREDKLCGHFEVPLSAKVQAVK